jgi:hypothetical protein
MSNSSNSLVGSWFDRLTMRVTLTLSLSKGATGKETAKRRKMG